MMKKEIHILVLIGIVVASLCLFWGVDHRLIRTNTAYQSQYEDACADLRILESENAQLQEQIASSNTDAFVEHTARSLYGYMTPDEVSFSISNPIVLYGPGGLPTRD